MQKPSRIPVDLVDGKVMVRALNGQDMLLVQQERTTANAPFAYDLATRLCDLLGDDVTWADVERVLLAAFVQGSGTAPELVADCPHCTNKIEACPDLRDLLAHTTEVTPEAQIQGWRVQCAIPKACDMVSAAFKSPRLAAADLRAQMVVAVYAPDGKPIAAKAVPDAVLDAGLAACNAAGFLILSLACPECDAEINLRLDPLGLIRADAARAGDIGKTATTLSQQLDWPLASVLALPETQRRSLARLVARPAA